MLRSPYPRLWSRMVSAVGVTDSFDIIGCLYDGVLVSCGVAFECEYVGVRPIETIAYCRVRLMANKKKETHRQNPKRNKLKTCNI